MNLLLSRQLCEFASVTAIHYFASTYAMMIHDYNVPHYPMTAIAISHVLS